MSGTLIKLALLTAGLSAVSVGTAYNNADITGAGASFPAPLIATWADLYRDVTNGAVVVNYQSIGSGGGIRSFIDQTVNFGATEAFLDGSQLAAARAGTSGEAYDLPITVADVVIAFNVPGLETGLVFDGAVLAAIFSGDLVTWNDARLAALNPDVALPAMPINVVHRADGSGTTNIFTNYLASVSASWSKNVGAGTAVAWPTGEGASGNEGVAGLISNTPGTIGYTSLVYATLNDIAYGSVINASGNVIAPSLAATSAAGDVPLPADARTLIVNTRNPDGYPIAGFSWALFYEKAGANRAFKSRAQAEETVRFLAWVMTEGQNYSELLDFARLPQIAVDLNLARLSQVTWQGKNIGAAIVDGFR